AWLRLLRSDFRDEPRRTETAGAGKSRRARNHPQKFVGSSKRRAVQAFRAREIEISLIDRNHFHDRRKLSEDRRDAIAPLAVLVVMAVQKNSVWAKLPGGSQRHRRVHAEFSRLVAR